MARRGRRSRNLAPAAEAPKAAATLPPARVVGDAQLPPFWGAFDVPRLKLAVARVVLFALLALDALLQIRHAPRYGTGFNVANLGFLDALAPGRGAYVVTQLALATLFVTAACGVATRVVVPIAAALYSWLYFASQLDSYQHHYLVAMVLVLASFVPWHSQDARVRSWALRLILVELAVMYAWAAISKLDASWLDGRTLALQLGSSANIPHDKLSLTSRLIEATIGWPTAAKLVVLAECTLAATVWHRRGWLVALPLGVLFHAGILFTDLDIGLFAQLMIAVYLLVVPDELFVAIRAPELPVLPVLARYLVVVPAVVLGAVARFDHAIPVTIVLAVAALAITATPLAHRDRAGAALLAAMLLWTGVDRLTSVSIDYYRLWGGSARRLGHLDDAEQAYRTWVALEPNRGEPRWKLGRVLLEHDNPTDGLVELHIARDLDPHLARAWLDEARWLDGKGRHREALEVARAGLAAEPGSSEARALVDSLSGNAHPSRPAQDD
jgi:hypothetical protein